MTKELSIFWFRRDLRLHDNAGLYHALRECESVLPLFIFDEEILGKLKDPTDARVNFVYDCVRQIKNELRQKKSDLWVRHGKPLDVFNKILSQYKITRVYTNHDYEPAARKRDEAVGKLLKSKGVAFKTYKDQCLFEEKEILTDAKKPYTVFTPYKRKVLKTLNSFYLSSYPTEKYFKSFFSATSQKAMPALKDMGFNPSPVKIPRAEISIEMLKKYAQTRDFPALDSTSRLGIHLRFGTVSVRELARLAKKYSEVWLSELIWRDFFMQILWHYPEIEKRSFRSQYDQIKWRKSEKDFKRWSEGQTGYPLVDAGMRELNATGFMHNRVRMVTASFLCKHLLIYWHEGERYFAEKLLDYDLAANNGNWQWAAGTGCDAAPYFRIFNPEAQAKKFDPDAEYIKKWVPEVGTKNYVQPMIAHTEGRDRCLRTFVEGLKRAKK